MKKEIKSTAGGVYHIDTKLVFALSVADDKYTVFLPGLIISIKKETYEELMLSFCVTEPTIAPEGANYGKPGAINVRKKR